MNRFLKAAEGRSVLAEDGTAWPQAGAWADDTLYIRRRLADGDLIEAEPARKAKDEPKNDTGKDTAR